MRNNTIPVLALFIALVLVSTAACGAPAPSATSVPPAAAQASSGSVVFSITGAVDKTMSWSLDNLKGVGMVKVDMNHPKKGKQAYEGVRLNALLSLARPAAGAKTLVMSAKDGYSIDVPLADVTRCSDCLLAIDTGGALSLAMVNLESATWVRDIVKIEVK